MPIPTVLPMSGCWSTQARVLVDRAQKMIDEKRAPTTRERQFFQSICLGAIDNGTDPQWVQCVTNRFMYYYYRDPDLDSDEEKQLKLTKQYQGAYGWGGGGSDGQGGEAMLREQTIMITPTLIDMMYGGDVDQLRAKLERDIGVKRHSAATPEERLKWTVKPMHAVLSWPNAQDFVDQWGGELVDGQVTFAAIGECLRRTFPGEKGDQMASHLHHRKSCISECYQTIGTLAVYFCSKRIFSCWMFAVQFDPVSKYQQESKKHVFTGALAVWLDRIEAGSRMHSWWFAFVSKEVDGLSWTENRCPAASLSGKYLLTDSSKTAWIRTTICGICMSGAKAQADGRQEAEDRLSVAMLTVVGQLAYGDGSWSIAPGTSARVSSDDADQWLLVLGSIALDMMDLFANCFGSRMDLEDAPVAASVWGMRWLLTTSCQRVTVCGSLHDELLYTDDELLYTDWIDPSGNQITPILDNKMGMRLLRDGEWLIPCVARAKRFFSTGGISFSSYSTKHSVDEDARIFMTTVMDQSLRALCVGNVEVWAFIVDSSDPATSVLKSIVSSGRKYDRHMAAQWDFSLSEVTESMRAQFWKVFFKLGVGPETLSPRYLDVLFDAAKERLDKRAKEEAEEAAAVEEDLLKSMEAEKEAEAKRKTERLASKDDRKEAEARRKASAEQRRIFREQERKEEQHEKEDVDFVEKWVVFITNANKYAKKNWEDYRAAEGKEKEKMRKNLYHRLDEYNKLSDVQKKLLDDAYWLCSGEYGHATEVGTGPLDIFLRTYCDYRQTEREEKQAAKVSRRPPSVERPSKLCTEPLSPVELSTSDKQHPVKEPPSRQQKKNKKKAEKKAEAEPAAAEQAAAEEERLKELALAAQRAELGRVANDTPPVDKDGRGGRSRNDAFRLHCVKTCNVNGGASGHVFTGHPPPALPPAMQECPDDLCCSITLEPMVDAACIPCGHTFSRGALLAHIGRQEKETQRFACPECRAYFNKKGIATNYTVQKLAAKYA